MIEEQKESKCDEERKEMPKKKSSNSTLIRNYDDLSLLYDDSIADEVIPQKFIENFIEKTNIKVPNRIMQPCLYPLLKQNFDLFLTSMIDSFQLQIESMALIIVLRLLQLSFESNQNLDNENSSKSSNTNCIIICPTRQRCVTALNKMEHICKPWVTIDLIIDGVSPSIHSNILENIQPNIILTTPSMFDDVCLPVFTKNSQIIDLICYFDCSRCLNNDKNKKAMSNILNFVQNMKNMKNIDTFICTNKGSNDLEQFVQSSVDVNGKTLVLEFDNSNNNVNNRQAMEEEQSEDKSTDTNNSGSGSNVYDTNSNDPMINVNTFRNIMDIEIHLRRKRDALNKLAKQLIDHEHVLSQQTSNELKNGTYFSKISLVSSVLI